MAEEPEATEARDPAPYDLVIRRAHVFDGHQARAGLHDVAVHGGQIAAVSAEPLRGSREVDAAEGWVMPGLIDTHLHFYDVRAVSDQDGGGPWVPRRTSSGCTTIRCGSSGACPDSRSASSRAAERAIACRS